MLVLTLAGNRAVTFMARDAAPWLARFAARLIARRLDVPEIVVHGICLYVAAYVSEVERNAALACPVRVFLDLRRNRSAPGCRPSSSQPPAPETRAA
jgi:hypothetical protein